MRVGDIASDLYFLSMNPGSVIKMISLNNDFSVHNEYIMRINSKNNSYAAFSGVCIISNNEFGIGNLWGNHLIGYKYEIIKIT